MNITDFSMDFFSLKGKNAIVTGGNSGLGQAFALALAKAGANIFVPTIMDDNGETKAMIEEVGSKMEVMIVDITKEGMPKKVLETCIEKMGSVDILFNCAGICINEPDVTKFGREQWDKMVQINLTALFEMMYEAGKVMIEQKSGKIINIGSMFSFRGGRWSPAYAATKHGVVGVTKAYCEELAKHNIQVNAIAPGFFATKLTEKTRSNEESNMRVLNHIPSNRWGYTADLMGAAVYLASRASDYVNGHVLAVDGGWLTR